MYHDFRRSRCPNCGRFVEFDANGYYDTGERGADPKFTSVACFCDETCACKFHNGAGMYCRMRLSANQE